MKRTDAEYANVAHAHIGNAISNVDSIRKWHWLLRDTVRRALAASNVLLDDALMSNGNPSAYDLEDFAKKLERIAELARTRARVLKKRACKSS